MLRLLVCVLAGALPGAAAAAAQAPSVSIAHSAQLTLQGSATSSGLSLRVRPTLTGAALVVSDLSVSVDGHAAAATRQPDGSWFVPLPQASRAAGGKLEVFVFHDGIREVLSGQLPAPAAGGAGASVLRNHQQLAWWILNIAIVLVAALAISRRMS